MSEVLDDLFANLPQLGARLRSERGELSAFVNVYVNGRDIRLLDGTDTPVGAEDVVILLPAMAGGSVAPAHLPDATSVAGGDVWRSRHPSRQIASLVAT